MVKTALNNIYIGGKTPTALQNEISTFWKMYYDIETRGMFNQSVNEFYTRFLLKIDALLQNVSFQLDIAATFLNNLSAKVREFLISEGFQVPPRAQNEYNYQGNHRLILVRNAAGEAEKNIRTIKAVVQPASIS